MSSQDAQSALAELQQILRSARSDGEAWPSIIPSGGEIDALFKMLERGLTTQTIQGNVLDDVKPVLQGNTITFERITGNYRITPTFRIYNLRCVSGGSMGEAETILLPMEAEKATIKASLSHFDKDGSMKTWDDALKRWWSLHVPHPEPLRSTWHDSQTNPGAQLVEVWKWGEELIHFFHVYDLDVSVTSLELANGVWNPRLSVQKVYVRGNLTNGRS